MSKTSLGARLRELRLERKMPLRKVAGLLDTDVAILSKMERGIRPIPKATLERLIDVYKADRDELIVLHIKDKVLYEINEEELGIKALKMAEEEILYGSKEKVQVFKQDTRVRIIDAFRDYFQKQKWVSKGWLFGSFARGEDGPSSDIDVVIDVPEEMIFTLFDLMDIKENLETLAEKKVDVIMLTGMSKQMSERVRKDMILIYEKG